MGNLLIPVIILLVAAIVSVLVIMVSGKNKSNNKKALVETKSNIDLMKSEPLPDLSVNESILPNVPMEKTVNESNSVLPQVEVVPKVEVVPQAVTTQVVQARPVVKKVVVVKKEVPSGPLPVVDIPVPEVNDTPITVEEVKSIVNENTSESIEVEVPKQLNETVNRDEIVEVEMPKTSIETEAGIAVQVEESKPITNDIGENVVVEESKPITNDLGETAFKSIPDGNTSINTNIKVEPQEYYTNKTEILNLEEIQEELHRIEENKRDTL